jgi:hypothetical protein
MKLVEESSTTPATPRPTSGRSGVKLGIVRLGKAGGKVRIKFRFKFLIRFKLEFNHISIVNDLIDVNL